MSGENKQDSLSSYAQKVYTNKRQRDETLDNSIENGLTFSREIYPVNPPPSLCVPGMLIGYFWSDFKIIKKL